MPRDHNVSRSRHSVTRDQYPVTCLQRRSHGGPIDAEQLAAPTKKQQQVTKTGCCQRFGCAALNQEAVTQASLRPLDCQNMPWIFSTAAISSSALA